MERGEISGFQAVSTQRIAGYGVNSVVNLSKQIAQNVHELHKAGLVHYDLKLRNILVKSEKKDKHKVNEDSTLMLCDLDASCPINSVRSVNDKKGSSAYYAPEVARWTIASMMLKSGEETRKHEFDDDLRCTPALDAWSFGVILYELCTGRHLFPQDLNDDSMVLDEDEMRLCLWSCIDDKHLRAVFKNTTSCSEERRAQAQSLIRWCLQGDPYQRPSFQEILRHPFIRSLDTIDMESEILSDDDEDASIPLDLLAPDRNTTVRLGIDRPSRPTVTRRFSSLVSIPAQDMRYHFFISHMQAEASGDVGTMYHLFSNMGINCWYVDICYSLDFRK